MSILYNTRAPRPHLYSSTVSSTLPPSLPLLLPPTSPVMSSSSVLSSINLYFHIFCRKYFEQNMFEPRNTAGQIKHGENTYLMCFAFAEILFYSVLYDFLNCTWQLAAALTAAVTTSQLLLATSPTGNNTSQISRLKLFWRTKTIWFNLVKK